MWIVDYNKKFAFKVFSDSSSLDEYGNYLETSPPTSEEYNINNFDGSTLTNTKIISDESGGQDISLDLSDRLINIIVDNSGSMSWNDSEAYRFDIIRGLINNLNESYPGDIEYNIVKYGGKRTKVVFAANLSSDDLYDTNSIQSDDSFADKMNNIYGIKVIRKIGSFPSGPSDGEIIVDGLVDKVNDSSLTEGISYYYNVYTYGENGSYSDPSQVMIVPKATEAPPGIRNFSAKVLKGSSVITDGNVRSVWHFNEGEGDVVYDFTTFNDLTIEGADPYWLNKSQVPAGESGLRFNGVDNIASADGSTITGLMYYAPFTFMGWIHAFDVSGSNIPIITRTNGSDVDWGVYLNNNKLRFNIDGSFTDSISDISTDEWVHVAISIDASGNLSMYINGSLDTTDVVATSSSYPVATDMDIFIGGQGSSFFHGYLCELSVHLENRDADYIISHSTPSTAIDRDNGDRIVILSFYIPDVSSINSIDIVKNNLHAPTSEQDGTAIYHRPLVVGDSYFSYIEDFVVDSTYNFRIFSVTSDGVYSNIFDSLNLEVYIPAMSAEAFQNISVENDLLALNNVTISSGKNKTYIEWVGNFTDSTKRFCVYSSKDSYPIIKDTYRTGTKVYEDITESFVDTELINDDSYFYSVFSVDRYQRTSPVSNLIGLPSSSNNNDDIPNKIITGLSYEILDENSINLFWDDAIKNRIIDGYFSDDMVIYSKIVDEFGNVLDKDLKVSLDITLQKELADNYAEDVFLEETTFTVPDDEELYRSITSEISSGYSSGIFGLRVNSITSAGSILKNIQKITVTIIPTFYIEDVSSPLDSDGNYSKNIFEYIAFPLTIRLINPFKVELTNLKNQLVNLVFNKEISVINTAAKEVKKYDGAYINSSEVFTLRNLFSYRGNDNVGPSQIEVAIYNATKDLSSNSEPVAVTENTTVSDDIGAIVTSTVFASVQDIEEVNALGDPSGTYSATSYADVSIVPPSTPQNFLIYVKAEFNGFVFVKKFFVVFANTLKIDLTPNVPLSNGIDNAEQFANIYIVDPDSPDDLNLITYPADNTLVQWTLTKDEDKNSIYRPLFSNDAVPITDGVYSYIENGVVDNVFIGPLFGIKPLSYDSNSDPVYEKNILTASVIYNGVSERASATLVYKPIISKGHTSTSSHFLMELDDLKQNIFSDGIDYAKMRITHDASSSTTKYSASFRECMLSLNKTIYPLQNGEVVYISASDPLVEIIWGDVLEVINPYTGRTELDTSNASISFGTAYVDLSEEEYTNVYFRVNKVYGEELGISGISADLNGDTFVNELDFDILTSNLNNQQSTSSEGDLDEDGVITVKDITLFAAQWRQTPKIITKDEIKLSNQCSTGTSDIKPVCNCMTETNVINYLHEIVISGSLTSIVDGKVMSFTGGGSIEKGIPATILVPRESLNATVIGKKVDSVSVDNLVIDGISENEIILDISAGGFPVEDSIAVFCYAVNYGDPVLNVKSNIVYCDRHVEEDFTDDIRSYISIFLKPIPINKTFKSELYVIFPYDFGGTTNDIKILKIKFFFDSEDTFSGDGEMFSNESYRIDINSSLSTGWESQENMALSRAFFASQSVNNKIYAIGGINSNVIENTVEIYDPSSNTWTAGESSPSRKFAASSVTVGNYIYIFGGIEYNIDLNKLFVSQTVERYDTIGDTWTVLSDMPSISDTVTDSIPNGVAFGSASVISGNVYILSGIRKISYDGRSYIYNDRVLKYDIAGDTWSYSDAVDQELSFYKRFAPHSFIKNNTIYVLGGAIENSGETSILKDSFNYNVVSEVIELSDNAISTMPFPSYKSAYCSYMDRFYLVGGSNKNNDYLRGFNILNYSPAQFFTSESESLVYALNGAAASIVENAGIVYLYVYGGIKSGKSNNFLLIDSLLGSSTMVLNNIQDINLHIELFNESGEEFVGDVEASVSGYLQSISATEDQLYSIPKSFTKYNVIIDNSPLTLYNGVGNINISARSEDILNLLTDGEMFDDSGENIKYKIILQVNILDSTYFGKNFVGFVSFNNSIVSYDILSVDILNNITIKQMTGNEIPINMLSNKLYQNDASCISGMSDSSYISDIEILTDTPVGDSEAITVINGIEEEIPLGSSPFESAIYESSIHLSNILYDDDSKLFITFCDDEANSSAQTRDEAIDSVLGLGEANVPVIISNISLDHVSSSLYESTTIHDYNIIASETQGQSLTFNDSSFVNDYIGDLSGGVYGALGQGSAIYIYDISAISRINNLTAGFTLPTGSDGRWRFAMSDDKYNYSEYSNWLEPNETVGLDVTDGRYIKFNFELFSGLNYNEYGGSFPTPLVTNVEIDYTKPKIDYIFMDAVNLLVPTREVVAITKTDSTDTVSQFIKTGISFSELSSDWSDFNNFANPAKEKIGKFFIPKRDGSLLSHTFEPLIRIDKFLYKTTNGSWDDGAFTVLFDSEGTIVDNNEYISYPRTGEIIFKSPKYINYTINIVNKQLLRIANEITNFDSDSTIKIYGWGYMYKGNEK